MRKFVLAVASCVLISACGATRVNPGQPASPSASHGGMRFDLTVTEKDHAVTMHAGQTLEVILHAGSGLNNWTHPTTSDDSVLALIVDPAATAVRGVTLGAFRAKSPGQADVTATSSPLCTPGQACPMYVALYTLKVTVTP